MDLIMLQFSIVLHRGAFCQSFFPPEKKLANRTSVQCILENADLVFCWGTSVKDVKRFLTTTTKAVSKFPGAPFSVSFSQLPAVKKDNKTVHLEIFLALLIL